jgi:hypothetical protein
LDFVRNGQILVENVIVILEDYITHVGEYQYSGRFRDELNYVQQMIDESKEIK